MRLSGRTPAGGGSPNRSSCRQARHGRLSTVGKSGCHPPTPDTPPQHLVDQQERGASTPDNRIHRPWRACPPRLLDHSQASGRVKSAYGVATATALRAALDPPARTLVHRSDQGQVGNWTTPRTRQPTSSVPTTAPLTPRSMQVSALRLRRAVVGAARHVGPGSPALWNGRSGFMAGEGHCGLDWEMDTHEPARPDAVQTTHELGQTSRRAATTMANLQSVQTSA